MISFEIKEFYKGFFDNKNIALLSFKGLKTIISGFDQKYVSRAKNLKPLS